MKVEQLFVGYTRNNFCPSGAQVEKELKMAGEKKNAIWALLLSTFQQNYHNNQLLIKPNEMVDLFCRDYLRKEPPPFCLLCFWYKDLSSEGS